MEKDVLIAGAGPVGLVMAIELARYGVAVRIIDKAPPAYRQIQGFVFHASDERIPKPEDSLAGLGRSLLPKPNFPAFLRSTQALDPLKAREITALFERIP